MHSAAKPSKKHLRASVDCIRIREQCVRQHTWHPGCLFNHSLTVWTSLASPDLLFFAPSPQINSKNNKYMMSSRDSKSCQVWPVFTRCQFSNSLWLISSECVGLVSSWSSSQPLNKTSGLFCDSFGLNAAAQPGRTASCDAVSTHRGRGEQCLCLSQSLQGLLSPGLVGWRV